MIKAAFLFCYIISCTCNLFSQTDSVYNFTLPEMKIKQKENGKTVTYVFEKDFNKFSVTDSFLTADPKGYKYNVKIADIKRIEFRNGTYWWRTALVAGAVGFGIGVLFGLANDLSKQTGEWQIKLGVGGILFLGGLVAAPLAIIGGVFGAISPYYEIYTLTSGNTDKKREELLKAIKNHKSKK
jgi:hypothetical protein